VKRGKRTSRTNRAKGKAKGNRNPARCRGPEYPAELARLELIVDRVKSGGVPDHVDDLCLNPTVELVELAWKNLPALLSSEGGTGPEPEPSNELVVVWKDPGTSVVQARAASPEDLLALKIVVEGISPEEAAAGGGVQLNIVNSALDTAVGNGVLLSPPTLIRRRSGPSDEKSVGHQDFFSAPIFTLQWHVTQQCDLLCRHCYDRSERTPLDAEKALGILDDFSGFCRTKRVRGRISFSGGNPLLYPRFDDLYRTAAQRGFTPAILGNPVAAGRIEELSEIGKPAFFQVSLEGLERRNDYVRGAGHFKRTIRFLKVLSDLGVYSIVMLTLTKDNMDDVLPLCELLRDRTNLFTFNRLSMVGDGANLDPPSIAEYAHFLDRYINASESNPIMGLKDNLFNIVLHKRGDEPFGGCTGYGCGAAFNFLAVLPDGEVHACRKFPSLIGNVFRQSLAEIYDSSAAQRYRDGCRACSSCEIRPVCGGCLAVASGYGLDIFEERDPYCFM
jgi:selenobiotic family peptide radical SAM maturase